MGPVGEIRLTPDPATFRVLPYADKSAAMTTDMLKLDGTALGSLPALVPQAADSGGGRSGHHAANGGRVRMDDGVRSCADGSYAPIDEALCFSSDRDDHRPRRDPRHRRGAGRSEHPGRTLLSRTGTRAAGDVDPPRRPADLPPTITSSSARRSATSLTSTACSPRSRPSRSSIRRATAGTSTSACGTQRASTT